jgi:hypothetical protein
MGVWRSCLARLAGCLPSRVITAGGDEPYLYKYLVWQSSEGKDSVRVHLHRFVRSDEDRELHNHPWRWAVSLVLAGGYREERRVLAGDTVYRRRVSPGSVNVITNWTYHRVDLLDEECWTLFVSGPVVGSWGFWNRLTGVHTPWREFMQSKGHQVPVGKYWVASQKP